MYFKKLEIFGFKSFADKTVLTFEKGITGIVGPNGCGKSNVFDAIRWVLGEQSMKELRGASREDVIFNGTDKKPSLGFAEVSLTLSNESRRLAIDYDEVTVTRRLFRSGESEYLLNKTVVRLKDIQELLMGTGLGAAAYSMIQQGKVDKVVSAKPEERREIFDEASGITKYKSKKREALNKLKNTEDNLLRVNDIVVEVKRQINSLERQASKAQKYKDVFDDLKEKELHLARFQVQTTQSQKQNLQAWFDEQNQAIQKMQDEKQEYDRDLSDRSMQLEDFETEFSAIREENIQLKGQIDLHQGQADFSQERMRQIDLNQQKRELRKEQLTENCKELQERKERLRQDFDQMNADLQSKEETYSREKENLSLAEEELENVRSSFHTDQSRQQEFDQKQKHVQSRELEILKNIERVTAQKLTFEKDIEQSLIDQKEVQEALSDVEGESRQIKEHIQETQDKLYSEKAKQEECQQKFDELNDALDRSEKEKLFLESQKEFIEKLHTQYDEIPDPVVESRFYTTQKPQEHHSGIIAKVKAFNELHGKEYPYEIICETKFVELDPQQIKGYISEKEQKIEELKIQKQDSQIELDHVASKISMLSKDLVDFEKSLSVLDSKKEAAQIALNRWNEKIENIRVQKEAIENEEARCHSEHQTLQAEFKYLQDEFLAFQEDQKGKQELIEERQRQRETLSILTVQLKGEIDALKNQLQNYEQNQQMLSQSLDRALEEIGKIDADSEEEKVHRSECEQNIQTISEQIEQIVIRRDSIQEELSQFECQRDEMQTQIQSLQSAITEIDQKVREIQEDVHKREFQKQELDFQKTSLKERLMERYKIDIDELDVTEQAVIENPNDFQDEINRLRKKCDSFGNVNLVAIDELEEQRERFEFLTQQQSDLLEAKSQLLSTIKKINKSTREMFMETFTKVSEEFRTYFRVLFGGGEATLSLLDPENVLESGIDITARPPGKKLQNISLMSGGEKTLTAIALVFAVFKVNPSPFCVLDEIDAALDDANVDRFCQVVKEFAKLSQFIVITHHKSTMASTDVLYGVTMPESGVSRTVSVKFNDEKKVDNKQLEAIGVG